MEATALHDFTASADDELSFQKGAVLKILNTEDDANWYTAEFENRQGKVPFNYINVKPHAWFHGKVSRLKAEEILGDSRLIDGSFLIRESESTPGDFSLSVRFQGVVQHFKVLRDGSGKYFLWVVKFNSLNDLVDYHRSSSVSRTQTIFLQDLKVTKFYRASFDFTAEGPDELSFRKGDLIELTEKLDDGGAWARGKHGDLEGIFPLNYVEEVKGNKF